MTSQLRETLASKLRLKRHQANITQAELARRVGVQRRQVQKWEAGDNLPSIERLAQIAKALNTHAWCFVMDLEELVELPTVEPKPQPKRRPSILTKAEEKPSLALDYWRRQRTHFGYIDPEEEAA